MAFTPANQIQQQNKNTGFTSAADVLIAKGQAEQAKPEATPTSIKDKFASYTKTAVGGAASGLGGGAALTAVEYGMDKLADKVFEGKQSINVPLIGNVYRKENVPTLTQQYEKMVGKEENPKTYGGTQLGGEIVSLASPVKTVGTVAKVGAEALGAGKLATKVAQAGAEGAAFTAGQGIIENKPQTLEDYAINSGLNAVFPVGGAALKSVAESVAPRIINSLIKPLAKDFAYGKNPGKTVSELGITGNSMDELISNIKASKEKIGATIGSITSRLGDQARVDVDQTLKYLDEALNKANKTPRTNASLIQRLEGVKADIAENINMSPQELKGLLGDLTKWTGNASDDQAVNKALKQTYGAVKEQLEAKLKPLLTSEEFAAYKKATEQYGDLISAENAAVYRDKILQRHDLISFGAKNAGLLTAVGTAVANGGVGLETLIAGLGGAVIDKAMATPAFKTRLASLLAKLPKGEIETFFEKVPSAKTLLKEEQIKSKVDMIKSDLTQEGGMRGSVDFSGLVPNNNKVSFKLTNYTPEIKKQLKTAVERINNSNLLKTLDQREEVENMIALFKDIKDDVSANADATIQQAYKMLDHYKKYYGLPSEVIESLDSPKDVAKLFEMILSKPRKLN